MSIGDALSVRMASAVCARALPQAMALAATAAMTRTLFKLRCIATRPLLLSLIRAIRRHGSRLPPHGDFDLGTASPRAPIAASQIPNRPRLACTYFAGKLA